MNPKIKKYLFFFYVGVFLVILFMVNMMTSEQSMQATCLEVCKNNSMTYVGVFKETGQCVCNERPGVDWVYGGCPG